MATEYFHEKHITGLFSRFKREMVQESRAALQASITARDAVAEEIRDDILEGVAANYSLVEDGTDIEIKVFEASAETNTPTNNESLV